MGTGVLSLREVRVTELADIPEFVSATMVAKRMRISLDALYRASDACEFARYYLFGSRKYYRLDEVEKAIAEVVPGDPERFRRRVAAVDAACPAQAGRRRRAVSRPARGSSGPTS